MKIFENIFDTPLPPIEQLKRQSTKDSSSAVGFGYRGAYNEFRWTDGLD